MDGRHSIGLAVAASTATALLVGGIAWAAIPDDSGAIHACVGRYGGIVRVIDTAKNERCVNALEVPLTWSQRGPQGVPGAPGPTGAPGVGPTVVQLAAGDPACPAGGAAITDAEGSTAYACSGSDGADGTDGAPFDGTFTSANGRYSISVTDTGIALASDGVTVAEIADGDLAVGAGTIVVSATTGIDVTSAQDVAVTVGRDLTASVGRNASGAIGGDLVVAVSEGASVSAGGDLTVSGGEGVAVSTGEALSVDVGGAAAVEVASGLAVGVGSSAQLQAGTSVLVDAGATATVRSAGVARLEGSLVRINGAAACTPVARQGDSVVGMLIATGAPTVCVG
jgi:hypothetical protein